MKDNKDVKFQKSEIFFQLIGYWGQNESNTVQPVFHYIKEVLNKYQLTPYEGREIVLDLSGNASPEWNKNVIPFITEFL